MLTAITYLIAFTAGYFTARLADWLDAKLPINRGNIQLPHQPLTKRARKAISKPRRPVACPKRITIHPAPPTNIH